MELSAATTSLLQQLPQPHQQNNNSATGGGDGVTYKKCCRVPCDASYLRMFHLACITIMATSFIVECILLNLIILPYLTEARFQATKCRFNSSYEVNTVKCENKCSKDRSSFPCHRILVLYLVPGSEHIQTNSTFFSFFGSYPTESARRYAKWRRTGEWKLGYLHDYHTTYNHYRAWACATSPCYKLDADNVKWVGHFIDSLRAMQDFPCHVHEGAGGAVAEIPTESSSTSPGTSTMFPPGQVIEDHILLYKLNSSTVVWNCIVWPAGLLVAAVFSIIAIYASNECHVWDTEKTVIA